MLYISPVYLPYISRKSRSSEAGQGPRQGVDAEAVSLPYCTSPVNIPYISPISQVKGVDAESVAATTAGAAEGLWEEHPYPHCAHK